VVCPFLDFFQRYGWRVALLILAFVGSYRLADFSMGVMANPFYIDMGFTLKEIAAIAKGVAVVMSLVGALVGGLAVARLGSVRSLLLGSVMVIAANLLFAAFAHYGQPNLWGSASWSAPTTSQWAWPALRWSPTSPASPAPTTRRRSTRCSPRRTRCPASC